MRLKGTGDQSGALEVSWAYSAWFRSLKCVSKGRRPEFPATTTLRPKVVLLPRWGGAGWLWALRWPGMIAPSGQPKKAVGSDMVCHTPVLFSGNLMDGRDDLPPEPPLRTGGDIAQITDSF